MLTQKKRTFAVMVPIVVFMSVYFASLTTTQAHADEAAPEVTLVSSSDQCAEGLNLKASPGELSVLELGDLSVTANAENMRVRRLCNVRLQLHVPNGFQAQVAAPEITYRSEHDAASSANISLRFFRSGTSGQAWFQRLSGETATNEVHTVPPDWSATPYACGDSPELNLLVDITARLHVETDVPAGDRREVLTVTQIKLPHIIYKRCVPST